MARNTKKAHQGDLPIKDELSCDANKFVKPKRLTVEERKLNKALAVPKLGSIQSKTLRQEWLIDRGKRGARSRDGKAWRWKATESGKEFCKEHTLDRRALIRICEIVEKWQAGTLRKRDEKLHSEMLNSVRHYLQTGFSFWRTLEELMDNGYLLEDLEELHDNSKGVNAETFSESLIKIIDALPGLLSVLGDWEEQFSSVEAFNRGFKKTTKSLVKDAKRHPGRPYVKRPITLLVRAVADYLFERPGNELPWGEVFLLVYEMLEAAKIKVNERTIKLEVENYWKRISKTAEVSRRSNK